MAEFAAYSSIENHYREDYIGEVLEFLGDDLATTQFVATEKIHGANFQFYAVPEGDSCEICVGKRKSLLRPTDRFFPGAVPEVRKKYDEKVKLLFELCQKEFEKMQSIILYGEIYGGKYPGFQAAHKPIQKQILYCPQFDFFAFDLRIVVVDDGPEAAAGQRRVYVPYSKFQELMEASGFEVYAKPIFTGLLPDCLKMNIKFASTLPALHGLPDPGCPNLCEGVVIKPRDAVLYSRSTRIMIKFKNTEWQEVKPRREPRKKKKGGPPPAVAAVWDDMERYVNRARLSSVISKIGEVTRKDTGKLIGLLTKDALEEYEKENPDWAAGLADRSHPKMVRKLLSQACAKVINEFFRERQMQALAKRQDS